MSTAVAAKPKKAATKAKKPADHPKYIDMVKEAIGSLKERNGSSRVAIDKYIIQNFKVGTDATAVNRRVKVALKSGVAKGSLKQTKGTGAGGSFRLGETKKAAKPKAVKAKKPKAAKKPAGEKKPKAKKPKTPKKKAAAKPKKSPAKKAVKAKKSPAKKSVKKTKSPKKAAKK